MSDIMFWDKETTVIAWNLQARCLSFDPVLVCSPVDQELGFQDKYLFYRFLDDEEEDTPLPSEDEKRESEEELPETILFLAQIGPDALLRMILRKSSVTINNNNSLFIAPSCHSTAVFFHIFSYAYELAS